jgi:hypothetical protein
MNPSHDSGRGQKFRRLCNRWLRHQSLYVGGPELNLTFHFYYGKTY